MMLVLRELARALHLRRLDLEARARKCRQAEDRVRCEIARLEREGVLA